MSASIAAESFAPMDAQEVMVQLQTRKDRELYQLLLFLGEGPRLPDYSTDDIEELQTQLIAIKYKDDYFVTQKVGGLDEKMFLNRHATRPILLRLDVRKLMIPLYKLPLEQRVAKVFHYINEPPIFIRETSPHFAGEMAYMGKDAVPFIVTHRPDTAFRYSAVLHALASIGDSRAIPYITEVLHTDNEKLQSARRSAGFALAKFKDDSAITALVAALKDDAFTMPEKDLPPIPGPKPRPFKGKFYYVKHVAGYALTSITGKDWGYLLNEDPSTWQAWLTAGRRNEFDPFKVQRTDEEWARLFQEMFDRYCSPQVYERPAGRPMFNVPAGIEQLASELKRVGLPSINLMKSELDRRVQEDDIWEFPLGNWTRRVFQQLPWSEARTAAASIKIYGRN